MKKLLVFLLACLLLTSFAILNKVCSDKVAHSQLEFTVTDIDISDVTGVFDDFDVKLTSSKPDFSDAVFELSAKVKSIDTLVEARDKRLKSAEFFDASKFHEMFFKSTSVKKTGKNKYKLVGDLSLHGVKKPVTMDLLYTSTVENEMDKFKE